MAVCLRTSEGTLIDIPIFNLSIHQKEGLKAICDIEVANQATTFPPLIDVFIDDICQFRGQVTGYLKHFTPHTAKIQLTQLTAPYTKEPDTPIQFTTPLEHLPLLPCNRQTRIKVETVLSSAQMAQLSTDTQITLEGKFSGKIVEYVISYTDKGCISTIVLCERATALEPETPPKLPSPSAEEAAGQSFVYDLDIQNLLEAQNAVITSKAEEPSTLPVTTVYLKLRDLRPKRLEPMVIKL